MFKSSVITRNHVVLVVCIVTIVFSSAPHSFPAYTNAFKAKLNLTQSQVSGLSSVMLVTTYSSLPAGILYDTAGVTITSILALIITSTGWVGLFLCTLQPSLLVGRMGLLYVIMGVACHGRTFTTTVCYAEGVKAVTEKYRYLAVIALESGTDLGAFLFAVLYETYFINGHVIDAYNQSVGTYMLTVTILSFVMNAISSIVLPLKLSNNQNDSETQLLDEASPTYNSLDLIRNNGSTSTHTDEKSNCGGIELETTTNNNTSMNAQNNRKDSRETETNKHLNKASKGSNAHNRCYVLKDVFRIKFQLLLWSTAFPVATMFSCANNITFITRSLSVSNLDIYLVSLYRPAAIVGNLTAALLQVTFKPFQYFPIIGLLLSITTMLSFYILLLLKPDNSSILFVCYIVLTVALAVIYVIAQYLVAEYFGVENFGTNLGILLTSSPLISALYNVIFGVYYDAESHGELYCYGTDCFLSLYVISVVGCALGCLSATCLLFGQLFQKL